MRSSIPLLILAGLLLTLAPAGARNQWDINHGASNPPMDPRFAPGGAFSGMVPAMPGGDFWKGQLNRRVPVGTVLTAILEDDISSAKSKVGDTFTLTLQDGFQINGNVMIPPMSHIIGSVTQVTPAKTLRMGNPGRIEISLQSLVFPDGRHMQIFAMIDSNPNHGPKKPAKVKHLGVSLADYGKSVAAMGTSFITGPGIFMNKINRGMDFKMEKGDALPIRLNRSLDIPYQAPIIAQPLGPGSNMPFPPGTMPAPGLDPHGPIRVPVSSSTTGGGVTQTPVQGNDPNAIFNQPVRPMNIPQMADPF